MSSRPRLAQLATDRLARERQVARLPPPSAAADARMIAAIADAIVSNAKSRRRQRLILATAVLTAAAAVVLGVGVGVPWRKPTQSNHAAVSGVAHTLGG